MTQLRKATHASASVLTFSRQARAERALPGLIKYVDPLDQDLSTDSTTTLTNRQLGRLVFIAAETGARFQREGTALDPVAWLYSSRALFAGSSAVDACREQEPFVRAIILHGLSIGLDANPRDIDALLADDCTDAAAHTGDEPEVNVDFAFSAASTA